MAKPLVFEGFIEIAPTNFASPVSHVMRFEPGGKFDLALVESGNRLTSRPLDRVKILGKLAADRVTNGVPVIRVEDVIGADWSAAHSDFSGGNVANWEGFASSLYPSIDKEPLPEAGFTMVTSNPIFQLTPVAYVADSFRFRLDGPTGWKGIVEASTNLIFWNPILTNTIEGGEIDFIDSAAGDSFHRFYRARLTAPE